MDVIERVRNCFHRTAPDKKLATDHETDTNSFRKQLENSLSRRNNFKSFIDFRDNLEDENIGKIDGNCNNILHPNFNCDLPNFEDLEIAFRDFLDELDLSPEKERQLYEQSAEKKWLMILEQNFRKEKAESEGAESCMECVHQIENFVNEFPNQYTMLLAKQHLESLSISLRTESFSFVQKFLSLDGACLLVDLLNEARRREADALAAPILSCFRALLNSSIGRNGVLESNEILLAISGALDFRNSKCKILSLEILSGLCLAAESGHTAVLKALTDARPLLGERTRFQKLVDDLHREHESDRCLTNIKSDYDNCRKNARQRETERVRIAIMSLVNALLKSGTAEQFLEFRLHLRYEFLMLGFQEVIDRLRNEHGSILEDHFDLFEMMRQEDEQELANNSSSETYSPIDFKSPSIMAEALSNKLNCNVALPHLISLLQHMLLIPGDERNVHLWRLFDLILQQLSLQSSMGDLTANSDPQFAHYPLNLNMDELMSRLRTQNEFEKLEKELIEANIELENERRRSLELENRFSDLQDGVSLSSFSRVSDLSSLPSDPCHSPTFFNGNLTHSLNTANNLILPPVRPPTSMAPPPPPPTAQQLRSGFFLKSFAIKKKVPKPEKSLKTLNWKTLPANQITGTVWENIDDEKLYKKIDLQELSSTFASASKNGHDLENSGAAVDTLQRRLRGVEPLVTVIDSRRAQNCTIMLSKLKLSHREIRLTVMSMDERGKLPKDMIEQMLKFVPTREEIMILRGAVQRHKTPAVLALADRFLYEMSQIPRYEHRLKCLYTIRTFHDRLDELKPYLNAVIRASTTLMNSKKLKQFLALTLAIGNFLNYGKHNGNAQGFSIMSLNAIMGVKSTIRSDRNLMHFIAELSEKKFPEILRLKRELISVYEASRFNRAEIEAEMRLIETSIREMVTELLVAEQMLNGNPSADLIDKSSGSCLEKTIKEGMLASNCSSKTTNSSTDRFIPVVKTFLESARKMLRETQILNREMEEKFLSCAKFYSELPADAVTSDKKCSPDEFFGAFAKCFNQFSECYQTIWTEREETERIKRQTLVCSIFTKKSNQGKTQKQGNLNKDFESLVNALQSGELFSEDLSRLRTSIRNYHGRDNRKSKSPIPSPPTLPQKEEQQNIRNNKKSSNFDSTKININMQREQKTPLSSTMVANNKTNIAIGSATHRHQKTTLVI